MEHDNNRSAAPTPEQLAMMNSAASAAVKEALASIMKEVVAPLLKEVALTPEKIAALKAPYVDQKAADREKRESQQTREQEAENIRNRQAMQANCLHTDKNGKTSICLIHNYPDRMARGICPLCHDLIEPRHWEISAPDPKTGKTSAKIVPAHKNYPTVLQLESMA